MRRFGLLLSFGWLMACGSSSSSSPPTTPSDPEPAPVAEAPPPETPETPVTPPAPPEPDPAQLKAELLAAETAAYEQAKPVFGKYCSSCHVSGNKGAKKSTLGHFDMTTYPFGGHHADEVAASIREVLAIGGGKATMPKAKPGVVQGDELALIAAWADAFDASHAGGAHEGHGGHGKHEH